MNETVKEKWKTALTSGEYEQGIGSLRVNNKYCCLGVLTDLYHKETGKGRWSAMDVFIDDNEEASSGFLTLGVQKWAGLPTNCPAVVDGERYLHNLNDTGTPFVEIAKLLDEL